MGVSKTAYFIGAARKFLRRKRMIKRAVIWLFAAVLAFSLTPPGREAFREVNWFFRFNDFREDGGLLEIHFMDVGKADAILIRSQGRAALIDAGKPVSAKTVGDYLLRHNVRSLDYAVMSHPDSDHIGGMPGVLQTVPAAAFVQGELPASPAIDTPEYLDLQWALRRKGTERLTLKPGESFSVGAATLTAYGPVEEFEDANNSSLVLRLDCGDFSALFCGDMEKEAEQALILSGRNLDVDLLKVGHHGSGTSSSQRFVWEVSPRYAVVSTGLDRNLLPRDEVLRRLEERGAEIYRTDTDGDILFLYDGEDVSVRLEKEGYTEYETVDHRPF